MPKINQFISTKSLAVDRSLGNNVSSKLQTELATASAQQSLAQGVGQFGRGVAQYQKSRDRINKNLAGFVGYKYLGSSDFDVENFDKVSVSYDSHNFEAGIKYSF